MSTTQTTPSRRARLLASALLVAVLAMAGVGLVLVVANRSVPVPLQWGARWTPGLWAVVFGSVGTMIATRVSGNVIGWLLLVAGTLSGSMFLAGEVAIHIGTRGGVPAPALLWYTAWNWIPTVALVIAALILFPTGRPRSRFWHASIWAIALLGFVFGVLVATAPEVEPYAAAAVSNPFAVDVAGIDVRMGSAAYSLFQTALLLGPVSLIARRRNADEATRQQLRWIAFAAAILVSAMLVVEIPHGLGYLTSYYHRGTIGIAVLVTSIPLAMGIAVLRYRLYDIDRVINRTVSYGLVTLVLAAIYATGVVGVGAVVRGLGGGGGDLVVAASTLAVAAAFVPLRRRVQAFVDRRFNRAGYDAQRTVQGFQPAAPRRGRSAHPERRPARGRHGDHAAGQRRAVAAVRGAVVSARRPRRGPGCSRTVVGR